MTCLLIFIQTVVLISGVNLQNPLTKNQIIFLIQKISHCAKKNVTQKKYRTVP